MNNLGKNKKLLLAKYPNGLAELDDFIAEEVELSGSRINWSAEGYDFLLPGISDRVNFNGTVSGDQLAGTLFSQQGNYTVAGKRLVDSDN